MSKTVRLKVYKFSELSKEVRDKLLNQRIQDMLQYEMSDHYENWPAFKDAVDKAEQLQTPWFTGSYVYDYCGATILKAFSEQDDDYFANGALYIAPVRTAPKIKPETARRIARYCHGGQWSALYQFCSSGVYLMENHLNYLKEIETCLHPEYDLHPGELTKRDENELTWLKAFIIAQGECAGLHTEFEKDKQYGYMVPYLTEDTPDALANKVKVVSYMK